MRLYEPNGQPFRDVEEVQLGRTDPGTGGFVVRAEDLVPGVYELDVIAPPLSGVSVTARAEVAPLLLSDTEASNAGGATAGARVTRTLVGAERRVEVTGRGAPPESLTVRVPDWASRAVIDVRMPREQWSEFSDFGVTEFDSAGQQVGQGAMNYAVGRHGFDIPPTLRERPVTVELFPAFARDGGARPWRATVRVRFLLREGRSFGDGSDVSVVPGGRTALPAPRPPQLTLPDGFAPLVELRAHSAVGADAVRRVVPQP